MTRHRLIMLLVLALLIYGIVQEQAIANDLDVDCGSICVTACVNEGGCRLFRQIGCTCDFVCGSGMLGRLTCGW